MKLISEYVIGDILYRYVASGGVFKYEVLGVRTYKTEVQLEVKCLTCTHGWKCEMLLCHDDKNNIKYMHMTNNDNQDEDDQSYWHSDNTYAFRDTEAEAKVDAGKYLLNDYKKQLQTAEEAVKKLKQSIVKVQSVIDDNMPSPCKG